MLKKRSILTLACCMLVALTAQERVAPRQQQEVFQNALLMERRGDLEAARRIYESLFRSNPADRRAFQQLKTVLVRMGDYGALIQLLNSWLEQHPNDLPAHIELGEAYYHNDELELALKTWQDFETVHLKSPNTYRMLFHAYGRFLLAEELEALVRRARDLFRDPAFLSLELANYYNARQTYGRALDEYLLHLLAHPKQQPYVTVQILKMSDDEDTHLTIEQRLLENLSRNEPLLRSILASFYFKAGRYREALEQHQRLGLESSADQQRCLELAKNLRLEKQYSLAIEAYHFILGREVEQLSRETLGAALLGLGRTHEDQIIIPPRPLELVRFYGDNVFFEDHFYGRPDISRPSLQATFDLYDSILVRLPAATVSPQVHYRLGEIQYRITRDFDGARTSYLTALELGPGRNLNEKIHLRLGDLLLAQGDYSTAREYFHAKLPSGGKGLANPFLIRQIQTDFLSGQVERAGARIDSVLYNLPPTDPYFNDLMELQDLITRNYSEGSREDQEAFLVYVRGEGQIRQYKLSEALETLGHLRLTYPRVPIASLALLRETLIHLSQDQVDEALVLAGRLQDTALADRGWTLAGEIAEYHQRDLRLARQYYHQLLEEAPGSLLAEPVRIHVRELSPSQEF